MHIIGILWLKTHYCSQFRTKMGFRCENLSLNDLTLSPISRPGTHCLQWQRANARANLWWRHEPFPGETSIALRPCDRKAWVAKRSWWCLGIISSNRCCQFGMISKILEEIHLNRAQDVVRKPLVYSAHCGTCWSQGSHCNYAREISHAIYSVPILVTSFVYRTNVYWSVIHGISVMELVSLRWNHDFTSASSYGQDLYRYAIATQWYEFHTTDAWWLSPNIDKCNISLCNEGIILKPGPHVKILSVFLDDELSFDQHVTISYTKAARQLNALARFTKFLNIFSRSFLYNSFIRSNFNHCDMAWHFCWETNNNKK